MLNKRIKMLKNNLKTTIWKYYLFEFLGNLSLFSAVLVPFFTDWGGISYTRIQLLQSWFMLWIFLLEIPTGAVADYLGRKHSLAIGTFVVAIATLIYGSIPRFEIFVLGEFIFAAGVALNSGANQALLYDALKEKGEEAKSKHIFGRAQTFRLLGMLIAAPVGSIVAGKLGLNAPILLTSIPLILSGIVVWSIKEPKVKQKRSESTRYLDIVKEGSLFFYRHKMLRLLAVDAVIVAAAAYFVIWLYQPLLKTANIPIRYFGFAHALLVAEEMLVSSNFVRLERLLGSGKRLLQFSAGATALGFLSAAVYPSLITILLLILFAGGFGLTRLELMSAYMNSTSRFLASGYIFLTQT